MFLCLFLFLFIYLFSIASLNGDLGIRIAGILGIWNMEKIKLDVNEHLLFLLMII